MSILDISIKREESPTDDTTITTCPPTPNLGNSAKAFSDQENNILPSLSPSMSEKNTENGFLNHAFSTHTSNNQISVINSTPAATLTSSNALDQQSTNNDEFSSMCSIILKLIRNTRYLFIVIANLFEGILLKGKSYF